MGRNIISAHAAELLVLINDRSEIAEDGVFWIPPCGLKTAWSNTLNRSVYVSGTRSAAAIRALHRRGLVNRVVLRQSTAPPYSCRITEDGRLLVESWLAQGTGPIAVSR